MANYVSQYKVGVIRSIEDCVGNKSKTLRSCRVNITSEDDDDDDDNNNNNTITVVTAASNVRVGSRVAVAVVGSTILNDEGEEMTIQKTTVGGVLSEGMLCDSRMLGWSGGAAGVAAQIPDEIPVGEAPPATKPRKDGGDGNETELPTVEVQGLFAKKLSKEEKKKIAEEKRKAKKAAKEAKKATEVEGEETES